MNLEPEPLAIEPQSQPIQNCRRAIAFRHRGLFGAVLFVPVGLTVLFSTAVVPEDSLPGAALNAAGTSDPDPWPGTGFRTGLEREP